MYLKDKQKDPNPPKPVKSFIARIFVQSHPGKLRVCRWDRVGKRLIPVQSEKRKHPEGFLESIGYEKIMGWRGGYSPCVIVRNTRTSCCITKISWKIGKKNTDNQRVENPVYIEQGDEAEIEFVPKYDKDFIVIPFDE